LLVEDPRYRSLKLSEHGMEILKQRKIVMGIIQTDQPVKKSSKKTGVTEHDARLFEILRAKRKELAEASGIPPYVIFPDQTLYEMAAWYPQSEKSLLKIYGVGQVKAERYGPTFLSTVQAYCQEHGLAEKDRLSAQPAPAGQINLGLKPRQLEVAEAYNAGQSVEELAEAFQVRLETILEHLWHFTRSGGSLRSSQDFLALTEADPDLQAKALAAFQALGPDLLKPVYETLGGSLNYDQLKLIRLHFLSSQGSS
jgi:ATP-dependent DNA helicase RecQ